MKKLFISQPMHGKSNEEILTARNTAIEAAKREIAEDVEVLESFYQDAPHEAAPLWYLGESLKLLAQADVAYFVPGWDAARGCKIEHDAAKAYGIKTVETE